MPTVLITGANRGLGLEFASQYAADGWSVIATCRNPDGAAGLHGIAGGVDVHALDVSDFGAVDAVAASLAGRPIDLLINNAGLLGSAAGFGATDPECWEELFRVNAMAPLRLAEGLVENVAASGQRKIVAITSAMGSISGGGGGYYPYRSSKAALNMVMKSLSTDLAGRGITVAVFHPGWARTDMGGAGAAVPVADSVSGMRRIIDRLGLDDTGTFWGYDGGRHDW